MNPALPLPVLIPLLALVMVLAGWLSWRGSAGLAPARRGGIFALRLVGVAAVGALLFNFGKWIRPTEESARPWLVLVDRSSSMAQPAGEASRFDLAVEQAKLATAAAAKRDVPLRVHLYDLTPDSAATELEKLPAPAGGGSDLPGTLKRLVEEAGAAGDSFAGVIALTDGRQTALASDSELATLSLRLRSRLTPFHAVAVGAGVPPQDLLLRATRPTVTVFKGQKARVPFSVEAEGLGPQRPEVRLLDESGTQLTTMAVEVSPGKPAFGVFEIDAPAASARWTVETVALADEMNSGNNRAHTNIRLLESKTRIFLAEGAPYWDSKFLAQLLRQQSQMELNSVHRLSEERYFRIDSGDAASSSPDQAAESTKPIFPETLEELRRYDLIVFGKNVDAFLTPERVEALRSYVRDHGGAVLFARGKPVTGTIPGLEVLEPVSWAATSAADFRFRPAADGEAAGLFGEALPPLGASIWNALPTLKDARQISMVKPFTRVLAEGTSEGTSELSGRFPALLVRRYGQGVCGLVNGDGLWKWDFYPEARELGNMYEDFWTQLIQWMASYSEFLPGQDFSLRVPALRGRAGDPVAVSISFRGNGEVPEPVVHITAPDGTSSDLRPASYPDPGGHPHWRASFTPNLPGSWKLTVADPRADAPPAPEATFLVPSPPAENDDLSADPEFLATFAESTGGTLIAPDELPAFLETTFTPESPSARNSNAIWDPSWPRWPFALLITLPLASEWYLRRRQGLA